LTGTDLWSLLQGILFVRVSKRSNDRFLISLRLG
jgi:hypothetical protein